MSRSNSDRFIDSGDGWFNIIFIVDNISFNIVSSDRFGSFILSLSVDWLSDIKFIFKFVKLRSQNFFNSVNFRLDDNSLSGWFNNLFGDYSRLSDNSFSDYSWFGRNYLSDNLWFNSHFLCSHFSIL